MLTTSVLRRSLACALLLLPALLGAQAVNVTVQAGTIVRTVDERIFGLNATMWDGELGSAQTISLLQQAGIRTIRIPGGSLSDEYHWRVNRTFDNTWTWASGMNKFADLITGLNAQAFVTVNYGTGTPEEAAAWVAYANAATGATTAIGTDSKGYDWQAAGTWAALRAAQPLATDDGMNFLRRGRAAPYGLKYWEIGNENYGPWETDEQAVKNDPTTYADRAKDYIAKMKAVDPTIKIGVVVVTSRENADYKNWTPVMLARLKSHGVVPDMVVYHRYEQAPKADAIQWNGPYESDAGLLQRAKTWSDDAADLRSQVVNAFGATDAAKIEIVVTENNSVYSQPGKQTTSLVNGLFLADSVGHLLQTEINALLWWDLRNGTDFANNNGDELYGWRKYGDYGIISSAATNGPANSYTPYPTYYAFKLLSRFARGGDSIVSATSNHALVSVFAAKTTAGGLNLLVINKDPSTSREVNFTLNGFTPAASAERVYYGKDQDEAARTGTGSTDLLAQTITNAGSTFSVTFAPYSMSVIRLTAGSSTPTPPPPTTPTTPTTPPTPPKSGGGGGGGGGSPTLGFLAALATLALVRRLHAR